MKDSQVYTLLAKAMRAQCDHMTTPKCQGSMVCNAAECPVEKLAKEFDERASYAKREEHDADQLAPDPNLEPVSRKAGATHA